MEGALYLAVSVNVDINTTYGRGTAARLLPVALLWACTPLISVLVAWTLPLFQLLVLPFILLFGWMLPFFLLLWTLPFIPLLGWMLPSLLQLVWPLPFIPRIGVDAAPYTAVGMDVAYPLYSAWCMCCPFYCC